MIQLSLKARLRVKTWWSLRASQGNQVFVGLSIVRVLERIGLVEKLNVEVQDLPSTLFFDLPHTYTEGILRRGW